MRVSMSTVIWSVLLIAYLLVISTNKAWTILLYLIYIGGIAYIPYNIIFGHNGRRYKPNNSHFGRRPGR